MLVQEAEGRADPRPTEKNSPFVVAGGAPGEEPEQLSVRGVVVPSAVGSEGQEVVPTFESSEVALLFARLLLVLGLLAAQPCRERSVFSLPCS